MTLNQLIDHLQTLRELHDAGEANVVAYNCGANETEKVYVTKKPFTLRPTKNHLQVVIFDWRKP